MMNSLDSVERHSAVVGSILKSCLGVRKTFDGKFLSFLTIPVHLENGRESKRVIFCGSFRDAADAREARDMAALGLLVRPKTNEPADIYFCQDIQAAIKGLQAAYPHHITSDMVSNAAARALESGAQDLSKLFPAISPPVIIKKDIPPVQNIKATELQAVDAINKQSPSKKQLPSSSQLGRNTISSPQKPPTLVAAKKLRHLSASKSNKMRRVRGRSEGSLLVGGGPTRDQVVIDGAVRRPMGRPLETLSAGIARKPSGKCHVGVVLRGKLLHAGVTDSREKAKELEDLLKIGSRGKEALKELHNHPSTYTTMQVQEVMSNMATLLHVPWSDVQDAYDLAVEAGCEADERYKLPSQEEDEGESADEGSEEDAAVAEEDAVAVNEQATGLSFTGDAPATADVAEEDAAVADQATGLSFTGDAPATSDVAEEDAVAIAKQATGLSFTGGAPATADVMAVDIEGDKDKDVLAGKDEEESMDAEPEDHVSDEQAPLSEMPHLEVPQSEVPQKEVQQSEVQQSEVPQSEVPQSEVPQSEVPQSEVPQSEVPQSEVQQSEVPQSEVQQSEAPQSEVPQSEVPQSEVPQSEVPQSEVPQSEVSQSEVPQSEVPQSEVQQSEVPQSEVPQSEVQQSEVQQSEVPEESAEKVEGTSSKKRVAGSASGPKSSDTSERRPSKKPATSFQSSKPTPSCEGPSAVKTSEDDAANTTPDRGAVKSSPARKASSAPAKVFRPRGRANADHRTQMYHHITSCGGMGRWKAQLWRKGTLYSSRYFQTMEMAARAADVMIIRAHLMNVEDSSGKAAATAAAAAAPPYTSGGKQQQQGSNTASQPAPASPARADASQTEASSSSTMKSTMKSEASDEAKPATGTSHNKKGGKAQPDVSSAEWPKTNFSVDPKVAVLLLHNISLEQIVRFVQACDVFDELHLRAFISVLQDRANNRSSGEKLDMRASIQQALSKLQGQ
ncbi:hypothetical protein CEUSTIGMA_g3826.t1 [Chlamydomonas eustigma]|uniref:Uncharacterized protein n=1 Tax=Chlamydomonas eustigma TaxID=1157962 RepID=A0A250X0V3_9CHLO|nr:hypothetical protein CEUSTIGMA_g3826.t1 [Chlamydomonas eustigma]|eukprot:GAX76380.1 hypothetical protein CEUSTIGMA_g3826.t1 [Chlamydomonas eustigma]